MKGNAPKEFVSLEGIQPPSRAHTNDEKRHLSMGALFLIARSRFKSTTIELRAPSSIRVIVNRKTTISGGF